MNKIFSFILCLTLVIGPVTAHAEEARAMDAYTKDGGTGSEKGKEFYMLQAGMIGVAIGGAGMFACVPSSYHFAHWIFTAGSAAFVVGEIAVAKEKTDYNKREKEKLKIDDEKIVLPNGVVDEATRNIQTAALQAAWNEEDHNKKMMEKRMKWAKIVALIYDIATIAAGVEAVLSLWPVVTGFVPDTLTCATILPLALVLGGTFTLIYTAKAAKDQSGGKLGLNAFVFKELLIAEIATAVALAIPASTVSWGRIVYYGGAAIIANMVKAGLEDRIAIANENLGKLQGAIDAWNAATGGSHVGGVVAGSDEGGDPPPAPGPNPGSVGGNNGGNSHPNSNYLNLATSGSNLKPTGKCLGSNMDHSSANCKNPLKYKPNFPKFDIGEISKFNQHAVNFANAVNADDMASAGISGEAILAAAGRIKAVKDQVLADAQKNLDKQGGKKQDLLASINAQHKNMMKSISDTAAKSGFGSGLSAGAGARAELDSASDAGSKSDAKAAAATASSAVAGAGAGAGAPATPKIELFSSADDAANAMGLTAAETEAIADNYAKNKNEYLSNNNDSLFSVITKTYVRNFDKILTPKKKIIEEAPKQDEE